MVILSQDLNKFCRLQLGDTYLSLFFPNSYFQALLSLSFVKLFIFQRSRTSVLENFTFSELGWLHFLLQILTSSVSYIFCKLLILCIGLMRFGFSFDGSECVRFLFHQLRGLWWWAAPPSLLFTWTREFMYNVSSVQSPSNLALSSLVA